MGMLDLAAVRAQEDPEGVLAEHAWLGTAIDNDAAAGRWDRWGMSTVIDENTGSAVISPALFAALHSRAGIRAQWPIGNAGLLHVYGYLLSTVQTPYGLKRARWLDGELAGAYGLAEDAFSPWASRTLLERVSEATAALLAHGTVRTGVVSGVHTAMALGRSRNEGPWALAYAVDRRLVTTFPVVSAERVLDDWDSTPPRLRWNAVLS